MNRVEEESTVQETKAARQRRRERQRYNEEVEAGENYRMVLNELFED